MLPTGTAFPTGTVTFLFTDIQGSTSLWEEMPGEMKVAVAQHHALLRGAIEENGGFVSQVIGDSFESSFRLASQGLAAAIAAQRALLTAKWGKTGALKVRMGLHTGPAELDPLKNAPYAVSHTLNRAARIMQAAHGGQILLSQETADLVQRTLSEGIFLKDMGEHCLKGLVLPEHLYQVEATGLPVDFPPLLSESVEKHNLPIQLTRFIGRETELEQVRGLLSQNRLVTLTGSGGVGKTRLALQAAEELTEAFDDGVWLVELAALGEERLVSQAIASVFNVREDPQRSLLSALLDFLRRKQLLIVLDNCEHLISACGEVVEKILQGDPGVRVLATSREALGVAGEAVYHVPSLSMPAANIAVPFKELVNSDAMRFFADRAGMMLPEFRLTEQNVETVHNLCARLDGIPLALELATARLNVLSLEQINARLDNRFRLLTGGSRRMLPRHQTLHALIDWSYELLTEAERTLFHRLSVFMGGWTLEAAEAVCQGGPIRSEDILDLLEQLVNKSLVQANLSAAPAPRYRMMETVRQYAQDLLLQLGEMELYRDRLVAYFAKFTVQQGPLIRTDSILEAAKRIDLELDNLRMSLDWALESQRYPLIAQGVSIIYNLVYYWAVRGLFSEGLDWTAKARQKMENSGEEWLDVNARAHYCAALLLLGSGDTLTNSTRALQTYQLSVDLFQRLGDSEELSIALCQMAHCLVFKYASSPEPASNKKDYTKAVALAENGLEMARRLGKPEVISEALHWNAFVRIFGGELDVGLETLEEAIQMSQSLGDRIYTSLGLTSYGRIALRQGDYAAAMKHFRDALEISYELSDTFNILNTYGLLGNVAYLNGDEEAMVLYYQKSLELSRKHGYNFLEMFSTRMLGFIAMHHQQFESASGLFQSSLRLSTEFHDDYGVLADILGLAGIAFQVGHAEKAARLLGAIEKILDTFYKPLDIWDKIEYEKLKGEVKDHLEAGILQREWAAGRQMNLEDTINYVSEDLQL